MLFYHAHSSLSIKFFLFLLIFLLEIFFHFNLRYRTSHLVFSNDISDKNSIKRCILIPREWMHEGLFNSFQTDFYPKHFSFDNNNSEKITSIPSATINRTTHFFHTRKKNQNHRNLVASSINQPRLNQKKKKRKKLPHDHSLPEIIRHTA